MTIKIASKIVDCEVVRPDNVRSQEAPVQAANTEPPIEQMHEQFERPQTLVGKTYKIKTPLSEHALYVTINDVILNPGTPHELRRPFEIFINSKNMDHFQWIVALTRILSAIFRKGGDCIFLVEELRSVFDPRGGYFKKGGGYSPSLVADIGDVIEQHLVSIGMIKVAELSDDQKEYLAQKQADYKQSRTQPGDGTDDVNPFPEDAQLCSKCNTKARIQMGGCLTCLNCGDSKCS